MISGDKPVSEDDIKFTDTSTDADGTITAWAWDFGDFSTPTEQHPTYSYEIPRSYKVTLTLAVKDSLTGGIFTP